MWLMRDMRGVRQSLMSCISMENSTEFKDESIEDKIENSIDKYYTDGFIEKIGF